MKGITRDENMLENLKTTELRNNVNKPKRAK